MGWPPAVLAQLWRRPCQFSNRSESGDNRERWGMALGTGTAHALVLGRNKAEVFSGPRSLVSIENNV